MNLKINIIEKISPNVSEMTEGEIYIAEFLKEMNIKFDTQVKIENLKSDTKSYRIADFYLPKYKIYIEYLGQWNKHEESVMRYKEKMKVYSINNIPCIYLYPENLGILEFIMNNRLKCELKKHKMVNELFRYRVYRLLNDRGDLFFWLFLCVLTLTFADYSKYKDSNFGFIAFFSSIIIYQIYRFASGYRKSFLND